MTGAPTLASDLPLTKLRRELRYTLARVRTRGWAKAWAVLLETELKNTDAALLTETKLHDTLEDAEADVDAADEGLDRSARSVNHYARQWHKGKQLQEVQEALFGTQYPSEFSKPQLGKQLTAMQQWPAILRAMPVSAMRACAPEVEAALKPAELAADALTKAETPIIAFRTGVHLPLVAKIDGMRQALLGEARKAARDTNDPAQAEGLFRRSTRRRPSPLTLTRARAEVTARERDLLEAKQLVAELEAAAQEAEQHKAKDRAVQDEISTLEKQQAATAARIAALRDELTTH